MADNWKEKYDKLLLNFKDLDRQNDVLYRCYHAARQLRNAQLDIEALSELYNCVAQVENFEKGLQDERK